MSPELQGRFVTTGLPRKSLFFLFFLYLLIYLAAPRLSCSRREVGSSSLTRDRTPVHWERGVLATGPPGKSPIAFIFMTGNKFMWLPNQKVFKKVGGGISVKSPFT